MMTYPNNRDPKSRPQPGDTGPEPQGGFQITLGMVLGLVLLALLGLGAWLFTGEGPEEMGEPNLNVSPPAAPASPPQP